MSKTNAKRIAVLGAGGIGGALAGYLARSGRDVTVIDQWPEHVMAIKNDGLRVEDVQESFTVRVTALHICEVSGVARPFDIVLLAFKSYDTVWATHLIAPHLAEDGFILPAQNGLNDDRVAGIVGYERTVGFVPRFGAAVYEPGHVVRTDLMDHSVFLMGELDGTVTTRVRETVKLFGGITPHGEPTGNILAARWTKFALNCTVNALSGILGDKRGRLSEERAALLTMIKTLTRAEVFRIAHALGIAPDAKKDMPALSAQDLLQARTRADLERLRAKVDKIGKRSPVKRKPQNPEKPSVRRRPSFLQDVVKGRKLEIEALNGWAVQKGRETGISTPMNAAICAVVNRIERGAAQPGPHNIEELGRALPAA